MADQLKEQIYQLYDELSPWGRVVVAGGLALALYLPYKYFTTRPRNTPLKEDYTQGVVYLYQFPRMKTVPSLSPFCLKLETWLRMADIQYENICNWWIRSLEGTLPFVEYNGKEYPDSSLCIRDLSKIFSKDTMESHLNTEQRAASRAFEALAENSLHQSVKYIRFGEKIDEALAKQLPENAFGIWTPFLEILMKRSFASRIAQVLKVVGIGKHSREEVVNIGNDDLRAISLYLGSKHYFTGFKPTRVDAALFGVLAQIVYAPYDMPQKTLIEDELTNLKEYCDRIKGRYWPDWNECTTKFTTNSDWKKKS